MSLQTLKIIALVSVLAVPVVTFVAMILQRILRKRQDISFEAPPSKRAGYETFVEFIKDAEELSVCDTLERMDGGVAPKRPESMKHDAAPAETSASEEKKDPAEVRTPAPVPGRWYRTAGGRLCIFVGVEFCSPGSGQFLFDGLKGPEICWFSGVEPAWPRKDEWWIFRSCVTHSPDHKPKGFPVFVTRDLQECEEAVCCGCVAPSNFGKGETSEKKIQPLTPMGPITPYVGSGQPGVNGGYGIGLPNVNGGCGGSPLVGTFIGGLGGAGTAPIQK